MNYKFCALAMAVLLLAGCAVHEAVQNVPAGTEAVQSASSTQRADREGRTELAGVGDAALYSTEGYSLYIPTEGWTLELESTGDIPHTTWTADGQEGVTLTVYAYEDMSFMVARDRFVSASGYAFESGEGGRLGDPIQGSNGYGNVCGVMVAEGLEGVTYVIAWEYPEEGAWAETLRTIADTFELTE